jgi:hypothetical protein
MYNAKDLRKRKRGDFMTYEEAKEILVEKIKPCLNGTAWEEPVDLAIEALETVIAEEGPICEECKVNL